MSWSISKSGTGKEVAEQLQAEADTHREVGTPQSVGMVDALAAVGWAVATHYGDRSVTVQSSGHAGDDGGSVSLSISIGPA